MITSTDNPKVKLARSLLERRGREKQGLCLVEGVRLIEDATRAGVHPAFVFFMRSAQSMPGIQPLLDAVQANKVPGGELTPEVFKTISDTVTSQGVIAILPIPKVEPPSGLTLALVLDRVRDPGNLGTILRGAAAAGVELVMLTDGCADPWSPKTLRSGMGAHFRLAIETRTGWTAIARRAAAMQVWVADAGGDLVYDQVDWNRPSILIVGGETEGFSPEASSLAGGRLVIPMRNQVDSLNAAMAATVVLFEAARQRRSGWSNE
jgi:RNA methyltransferase, TrmH family